MAYFRVYLKNSVLDSEEVIQDVEYTDLQGNPIDAILSVSLEDSKLKASVVSRKGEHLYSMLTSFKEKTRNLVEIGEVVERHYHLPMSNNYLGAFNRAHHFLEGLGIQCYVVNKHTNEVTPYIAGA